MGIDPQLDHDWEAFRYVAGEMSAAETEAIEAMLLTDQALREAVASVVELTESISILGEEVAASPVRGTRTSIKGKAAAWAVAAGLALMAMLWPLQIQRELAERAPVAPADANLSLDGLAESWTALRQAQRRHALSSQEASPPASESVLDVWEESDVETAELESFPNELSDAGLPAWLIAAAELDALSGQEPQN